MEVDTVTASNRWSRLMLDQWRWLLSRLRKFNRENKTKQKWRNEAVYGSEVTPVDTVSLT